MVADLPATDLLLVRLGAGRDKPVCSVEHCESPVRARGWCSTHWSRWKRTGDVGPGWRFRQTGDFWSRVSKTATCWYWNGAKSGNYGQYKQRPAHRVSWEMAHGQSFPEGMQIDHLCRNTRCVNPDHLEAVTARVNVRRSTSPPAQNARKTHCHQGHEFTQENTIWVTAYKRRCRACARIRDRRRRAA